MKKMIVLVLMNVPKIAIQAAFNGTKVEFALPFEVLQITKQQPFHVNLSRKAERTMTY
jgi:hypothetical protein